MSRTLGKPFVGEPPSARTQIARTEGQASKHLAIGLFEGSMIDVLYNLRYVQNQAAQLNFILRQQIDPASRWERKTSRT